MNIVKYNGAEKVKKIIGSKTQSCNLFKHLLNSGDDSDKLNEEA